VVGEDGRAVSRSDPGRVEEILHRQPPRAFGRRQLRDPDPL
jgi:hypothetical protein